MRMSCNGCRVLRKGCSDDCSIRPCLQWIKTPESQSHATVFLAKFYGRAGLMNLINAGPEHLRPSIFKSLLYEACGRIVNPIYGSSGLLWSGNWHHCQAAVDAVLKGSPIMQLPSDAAAATHPIPPLKAYDIRHVSKESNSAASQDIHRVKTRNRFKRSAARPKPQTDSATNSAVDSVRFCNTGWGRCSRDEFNRTPSYDSTLVQQGTGDSREGESMSSVATGVASLSNRANPDQITKSGSQTDDGEVELELTLGLNPASRAPVYTVDGQSSMDGCGDDICKIELGPSYTCAP